MKVQEIEAFLAVCQYGSFTRAAEKCYTTQPNISWQIASLEKKLGHQLIVRGKGIHQFRLTKAGELFLPQAEKWLNLWRETERILEEEGTEHYSFSCVPSIGNLILPRLFQVFQEQAPDCIIEQSTRRSTEVCSDVEYGRTDCGIVCDTAFSRDMLIKPIASEKIEFICRRESRYHGVQKISELDISKQMYMRFSNEEHAWQKRYLKLGSKKNLGNFTAIQKPALLFTVPDAWALVPHSYLRTEFPEDEFVSYPLDVEPPRRKFLLVSQISPRQPYYDIVYEEIRKVMAETEGFELL